MPLSDCCGLEINALKGSELMKMHHRAVLRGELYILEAYQGALITTWWCEMNDRDRRLR